MSKFFNRKYNLFIGPSFEGIEGEASSLEGVIIDALRVDFRVEQDDEETPNNLSIDIYNIGKKTRSLLEEVSTKIKNEDKKINEPTIILNAGYEGNVKTLFVGDISDVETGKNGTDIITSIEAGDGEAAFSQARLEKSFAPGTNVGEVLRNIKGALGVESGEEIGVNASQPFENGLSVTGSAKSTLDYITQKQGLTWSIQNNKLQILPPDTSTNETAFVLSATSGLIGTPSKIKEKVKSTTGTRTGRNSKAGIRCTSLLNPEIKPGRKIIIESFAIEGEFVVTKVTHKGDNYAQSWYTEIEAK